jgi:hypothetical protein
LVILLGQNIRFSKMSWPDLEPSQSLIRWVAGALTTITFIWCLGEEEVEVYLLCPKNVYGVRRTVWLRHGFQFQISCCNRYEQLNPFTNKSESFFSVRYSRISERALLFWEVPRLRYFFPSGKSDI